MINDLDKAEYKTWKNAKFGMLIPVHHRSSDVAAASLQVFQI